MLSQKIILDGLIKIFNLLKNQNLT